MPTESGTTYDGPRSAGRRRWRLLIAALLAISLIAASCGDAAPDRRSGVDHHSRA